MRLKYWAVLILLFLISNRSYAINSYVILSASKCGEYAIFQSGTNGRKILVDTKKMKIVCPIDSSLTPLSWISDSVVLFQQESTKTYFLSLAIKSKRFTIIDSVANGSKWLKAEDADFVSFPNTISSSKSLFFIYTVGNKIYRYDLSKKVSKEIWTINLPVEYKMNNISVNSDCSVILLSCMSIEEGRIFLIDMKRGDMIAVDEGKDLRDKATYIYFLQNDDEALYYKVIGNVNNLRTIAVYLYRISDRSKKRISNVQCVSLINPFKICSKNLVLINNVNPLIFSMPITKSFLKDFVDKIASSIGFTELQL